MARQPEVRTRQILVGDGYLRTYRTERYSEAWFVGAVAEGNVLRAYGIAENGIEAYWLRHEAREKYPDCEIHTRRLEVIL